ncbi:hypothetical protein E3N88_45378 [Mikania micrantha]|uniref:Uncharacterized protein n=1 Tax=Mikania micrantha TaxID=192012 RepID=A0A5N6L9K0_9ASTR|nr:hypothetical protein E3N88_45378 [Mikania micrantha]
MAVVASKFVIYQALPKRGQIKIKIYKMIAKSIRKLANDVVGKEKSAAVTSVETAGEFKSGSKHVIKQNKPKRGHIKIKIFKMIAKSMADLVTVVAGGVKNTAGNGGCTGGWFTSPATVIPVEVD